MEFAQPVDQVRQQHSSFSKLRLSWGESFPGGRDIYFQALNYGNLNRCNIDFTTFKILDASSMSMANKRNGTMWLRYRVIEVMLFVVFGCTGIGVAFAASGDTVNCGIALIEAAEFEKSRDLFEEILQHDLKNPELQATYICLAVIEIAFNRKDKAGDLISELINQFSDIDFEKISNNIYIKNNKFLVLGDFKEIFDELRRDVPKSAAVNQKYVGKSNDFAAVSLVESVDKSNYSDNIEGDSASSSDSDGVNLDPAVGQANPAVRLTSKVELQSVEKESGVDLGEKVGNTDRIHPQNSRGGFQAPDPAAEKANPTVRPTSKVELQLAEDESIVDPVKEARNTNTTHPEFPRGDSPSPGTFIRLIDFGIVKEEGVEIERVVKLPVQLGLNSRLEYVQTAMMDKVEFRNIGVEDLFYVEVPSQSEIIILFKVPPSSGLENGLYKGTLKFRDKDDESKFTVDFSFDLSL